MEDEYRLDAHDLYEMLYFWNACDEAGRQDLLYFNGDIGSRDNYLEWAYDLLFQVFPDVDGMFYGEDESVSTFSITSPAMQAYLHHAYWHGHKHGLRHEDNPLIAKLSIRLNSTIGESWYCDYRLIIKPGRQRRRLLIHLSYDFGLFVALAPPLLWAWEWFEA